MLIILFIYMLVNIYPLQMFTLFLMLTLFLTTFFFEICFLMVGPYLLNNLSKVLEWMLDAYSRCFNESHLPSNLIVISLKSKSCFVLLIWIFLMLGFSNSIIIIIYIFFRYLSYQVKQVVERQHKFHSLS